MEKNISSYNMNKSGLRKLTKSRLIELLLQQTELLSQHLSKSKKPKPSRIPVPIRKPSIATRPSVKEMVKQYEENIILPPLEFRDDYKPVPAPRTKKPVPAPRTRITQVASALKGYTQSFEVGIKHDKDPLQQMQTTRKTIELFLLSSVDVDHGVKFLETLKVSFSKPANGVIVYKEAFFNSDPHTIINELEAYDALQLSQHRILDIIAQWVSEGSGWTIRSVDGHYINTIQYQPMTGSSYIDLPKDLRGGTKKLVNMKNEDNECFRWCHIRYLNPQNKDPQRIKKVDRLAVQSLNYNGVEFPVAVKSYNRIERQNSININVFGYEGKQPFPIYISKEKHDRMMNLLLITKDENKHYVLIRDFNAFMFSQTKHKGRKHFCMSCLQCFSSERVLNNHSENCLAINGAQAVKMPDETNNILRYNNHHKQMPVPFVIYADFEAITEKVAGCTPSGKKSYTQEYQKHTDCGYGYKVVCCYDDKYTKAVKYYRGEKAVYKFMEAMLEEVKDCKRVMKTFTKPLVMTEEDEERFAAAEECHICNKEYVEEDIRVRDHCHITGLYRGSAHRECNLLLRINPEEMKIPVIFHNLKGYDSHFIMQEIGAIVKNHEYKNRKGENKQMNINAIPNNMEKYMAFMLGNHLTFIDSFQFMSSSLEKLVKNMPKECLKYTSQSFKGDKLSLVTRKGVYPYDFMDSFDKFQSKLPSKKEFYSVLNNKHISDDDYKHAQDVWNEFSINNMGEYHDLYLKSDILLLADVFEAFRKTCLEYYKLDPCHYFTSPGLAWDAMLKMTKIELELMTDIDMYQFIEKGMRGGISYIANRYGKANNKYMKTYNEKAPSKYIMYLDANNLYGWAMKEYNEKAPSKYIMYLDANNLYGWAMSQYLPTGGFRWLTQEQIDNVDLTKYTEDSEKGLVMEVDLEYPEELHDLHNDYPLGPEKVKVTRNMLSEYCENIAEKYGIAAGLVHKLIPTLNNKEKYVLHYRNLQLYTDLGLKTTKIHRVLEFNQSPWLKQYIDFNTEKRKSARNAFEKDFFKLMNNSVFGKTMENIRKRVDVRLVTDEKKLLKYASKPTYVSHKIFNENLVAVHKIKETLTLNRPAYVGMCILDLSKTLMYDFHYNYIKKNYGDKAKLLFTDTDSLTYEIEAEDVYRDFQNDQNKFDNSDYPESSPYFDKSNKKVIGKFKDEAAGVPICEFVGLRSKMYSYMKDDQKGGKTAKGVKKSVIQNSITHENYVDTLFNKKQMHSKMKTIRSQNHELGSYEINKISLSCFDDKRYILEDGVTSYAYGHKNI
nr:TPA_asm: PolB [Corynactis coral adintovirus]